MIPLEIYHILFDLYGPQGWWPLLEFEGINPTKTGCINGYHPNNYDLPSTRDQVYQVCIGAVLAQSIGWSSVEKALLNLNKLNAINPERLMKLSDENLKEAIKPTGYFNVKAKKLRIFTDFFMALNGKNPTREELLGVWGIGKETADSILLYAYKVPTFVVDAYTKRIFSNLGFFNMDADYDEVKQLFETNIKPDLIIYQEYHALIVEHAKRYCRKKPECRGCPINGMCAKNINIITN